MVIGSLFLVGGHDQRAGHAVYGPALLQGHPDPRAGDLAGAALAAQLADDLDGVHPGRVAAVTVGEQAAVGVRGHRPAQAQVSFLDVVGPLPQLAEAHLLQVADGGDGEAVVQAGHVDLVAGDPGHAERPVGRLAHGLALVREPGVVDGRVEVGVVSLGAAQDPDRLLAAVDGPLGRGDHDGVAAVVVDRAVQQVQRLAHVPGGEHVLDGDLTLAAHHRVGVEGGVVAGEHGDFGQVGVGDVELVHVPPGPHRVPRGHVAARGGEAPVVRYSGRADLRGSRAARAGPVARAAEEQDRDVGQAGRDGRRGLGQLARGAADLDQAERALAELFGPELVRGGAGDVIRHRHRQQAVDVGSGQPGVVQGTANRLELERERSPFGQFALLCGVDADDGRLPFREYHLYPLTTSSASTALATLPSTRIGLMSTDSTSGISSASAPRPVIARAIAAAWASDRPRLAVRSRPPAILATASCAWRRLNGARSRTVPPTISISTPPMPTATTGPNTGSRCSPQEISTEAGTISWTRTPSTLRSGLALLTESSISS